LPETLTIEFEKIRPGDQWAVGGKALALSRISGTDPNVPLGICVSTEAYDHYVRSTGLRERILMELNRKKFEDMRWEEMWDASLRIRNLFANTTMPGSLRSAIGEPIKRIFAGKSVAVRSSAPGEDSAKTSFAGLHESYVNIRGPKSILEHIRLVWASLWSDAAILYRRELGLDIEKNRMAVIVQEFVAGDSSGVVFGMSPTDPSQALLEAVHGLNQGLVDGTVEPDHWALDRKSGSVMAHRPAERKSFVVPAASGVKISRLPLNKLRKPPLSAGNIGKVFRLAGRLESVFGVPQDVEWTITSSRLVPLQSRNITTGSSAKEVDKRSWYLSLRRSFENLKQLRQRIEKHLLPQMTEEAADLERTNPRSLTKKDLAREIDKRRSLYRKWLGIYWSDFIPFAHGVRLFGQFYNDKMHPADPYEFMDLLSDGGMISLRRNRMLEDIAHSISQDKALLENLRAGRTRNTPAALQSKLDSFLEEFAEGIVPSYKPEEGQKMLLGLLVKIATGEPAKIRRKAKAAEDKRQEFLARFRGQQRAYASDLLDLAKASHRLRDDDNVYLGRFARQLEKFCIEGRRRGLKGIDLRVEDVSLRPTAPGPSGKVKAPRRYTRKTSAPALTVKARQLIGQPAGPGLAQGQARVVVGREDLRDFKAGEIMVCQAIDPSMTFILPLAAAVVEQRGGMLIHGAIIAREYGLPCVTGVPEALGMIPTGTIIKVDGFLGIVTLCS
jgi:pyruvate,water dikinase